MARNASFARHRDVSFAVMERMAVKKERMEIAKSAAPIATPPQLGR